MKRKPKEYPTEILNKLCELKSIGVCNLQIQNIMRKEDDFIFDTHKMNQYFCYYGTAEQKALAKIASHDAECKRKRTELLKSLYPIDSGKVLALHNAGWSVNEICYEMTHNTREEIEAVIKDAKRAV